ncbi:MAG: glycosyltransferase family 2 protein [Anaerolineaceae bacterium]|jgi:glycosyltransferase involved in cell wall biosynthesis
MPDQPLVSIVTPSYNQAAFLEQTLRSVLDQDYPNLEYMVVDGGSDDGSVEIIERYESRLAWWVSEKDRGQAEAINKGLAHAKGEYIAWLNSDDFYLPGAIRSAVEALQARPDAALVYGDVLAVDAASKVTKVLRYANWGLEGLMGFNIIGQPAVFMRRAALERAGTLDLSYHYLLDHQLWLRVAQQGAMQYVPQPWAAARFHSQSKNVAASANFGKEAYRIVEWMQGQPALSETYRRLERKIWAGAHRINARYLLDADRPREAFGAYWKSLRADAPTALKEWNRMVYCLLAMAGLKGLRPLYQKVRESASQPDNSIKKG